MDISNMTSARMISIVLVAMIIGAIQQVKGAITSSISVSIDMVQPTPLPEGTASTPCIEDAFFCNEYNPVNTGLHLAYMGTGGLGLILICLGCCCITCVKCCRRKKKKGKYDVKLTEAEDGFILIPGIGQGNDYTKVNPQSAMVLQNNKAAVNDKHTGSLNRKGQDQFPRGRLVSGPTVHTIRKKNDEKAAKQSRPTSQSSNPTNSPQESVDGPALPPRNRNSRSSESSLPQSPLKPASTGALEPLLDDTAETNFITSPNAAYGQILINGEVYSEADVFENPATLDEGIYDNDDPGNDSEGIYDNESLGGNNNKDDDNIYDNEDPVATVTSSVTVNVAGAPEIPEHVPIKSGIKRSRSSTEFPLPPTPIEEQLAKERSNTVESGMKRSRCSTPLPPTPIEEQLAKERSNIFLTVPKLDTCKIQNPEDEDIYEDTSDLISADSETTVEDDGIYEDTVFPEDTGIYEDVQGLT